MYLVNKKIRRNSETLPINGKDITLFKAVKIGSKEFYDLINEVPNYKEFYVKKEVREGSRVRLSDDEDIYSFGCNEDMEEAFGTVQTIDGINKLGRVYFVNENGDWFIDDFSYGLDEIVEVIEY